MVRSVAPGTAAAVAPHGAAGVFDALPRTLAAGTGAAFELAAGRRLAITTPDGHQGGDVSFAGFDRGLTRTTSGFVASSVTDSDHDVLSRPGLAAGDRLVPRPRRPVVVAVSACPDTELPGWAPGAIEVELIGGR